MIDVLHKLILKQRADFVHQQQKVLVEKLDNQTELSENCQTVESEKKSVLRRELYSSSKTVVKTVLRIAEPQDLLQAQIPPP